MIVFARWWTGYTSSQLFRDFDDDFHDDDEPWLYFPDGIKV